MSTISLESKEETRQHPDFEAADLTKDANPLWKIITVTHLTAIQGAGNAMKIFDQMALRTKFAALKQTNNLIMLKYSWFVPAIRSDISRLDRLKQLTCNSIMVSFTIKTQYIMYCNRKMIKS
jgi:hypothetical protein